MDIVSIELGIGMLLLFVVPVVYAVTSQSRKEKKTIKKVEEFCGAKSVKITTSDIFHSLFIGIDESSKYLAVSSVPVKEENVDIYNLKEVKSCNLIKKETAKPGQPKATFIEKIAIELVFVNKQKLPVEIVFFDDETGMDSQVSLNQAGIWVGIINKNL